MPLRLFFPEWQGYAVDDGCRLGGRMLRERIFGAVSFVDVPLAPDQSAVEDEGIVARPAIVQDARACAELPEQHRPTELFTLGGTCAVELGPVAYLNGLHDGALAVLWLDAHGDLNTPASSPSGHFHGMPLRTLLGEGDPELVSLCRPHLRPEQVFLLGARELDPGEQDYLAASAVTALGVDTPARELVRRIREAGFGHVYVHLDLDVLEPADFDEVIYPVAAGLRLERLLELLEALANHFTIVGSSLLEFVPGAQPRLGLVRRMAGCLGVRG